MGSPGYDQGEKADGRIRDHHRDGACPELPRASTDRSLHQNASNLPTTSNAAASGPGPPYERRRLLQQILQRRFERGVTKAESVLQCTMRQNAMARQYRGLSHFAEQELERGYRRREEGRSVEHGTQR